MGTWDSGVESVSKRSLMEESSLRHGTIIPVIGSDSVGTCCHQGRRAYQEDKFIVAQLGIEEDGIHATMKPLDRKHQNNSTNIMLLAVFDGHGGDDCAHYCQENLQRYSNLFFIEFLCYIRFYQIDFSLMMITNILFHSKTTNEKSRAEKWSRKRIE